MMKLIGVERTALLFALIALNVLIVAVYLFGIGPMRSEAQSELALVNSKIASLDNNIRGIKAELDAYPGNYDRYLALEDRGFFSDQNRFEAGRMLDALRLKSGLLGYAYNIDAIEVLPFKEDARSKLSLVNSRIKLDNISAILDLNFYTLLYNLSAAFPAHARIEQFELRKKHPVTEASLTGVMNGTDGFVSASVVVDWLTMIPKDKIPTPPAPGAHGD